MTAKTRSTSRSIVLGAVLLCAVPAFAQEAHHQTVEGPRTVQQSVDATATIAAIDKATRTVTLKVEDGTTTEIVAGPDVKRFDEFAVGDKVHARYTIGFTTELRAPTDAEKADPLVVVEGGARASDDAAPGAGAGRMIRVVATIEAIDRAKNTVTLKGPNGNTQLIEVSDPGALEKPKVGDTVVVTIAEAVALQLEKVGAAKSAKK